MSGDGPEEIEHAVVLVRFAEAITRVSEDKDDARAALRDALGDIGVIESSGVVGIFNGLVRTADFSGIPLDEGTLHASADFRERLGLNDFTGAANTNVDGGARSSAPSTFFDFSG